MSWFGLSIASQGLFVAKGALDVTAHNISNANTDGYTRQKAIQQATRPISTGSKAGMWGTGAEITEIKRMRDQYFDTKFWNSNSSLQEYETKKLHLEQLEKMFNEPSDAGFTKSYTKFMDSLQDLSKFPADPSYKAQAIGMAGNFAAYFNTVATSMSNYQRDLNQQVKQLTNEINNMSTQIAKLNDQIYNLELTGDKANDLRDQRDLILDKLSSIVPIDVSYDKDNFGYEELTVKINGETLVSHRDFNTLKLTERTAKQNPEDIDGLYDISWSNGNTFYINHSGMTGQLQGVVDLRDGHNGNALKGVIENVDPTGATAPDYTVTLKDVNRFDIQKNGEIVINNTRYSYKDVSYDKDTGKLTLTIDGSTGTPTLATADVGKDAISGSKNSKKGIPYYIGQLNDFVRQFATEFNKIHLNGQLEDGTSAGNFFVAKDGTGLDLTKPYSYTQITAANFAVSQDIQDNHKNFATNKRGSGGESENKLVLDLIKIKDMKTFRNSDPANYMEMVIADIGIDSMKAATFSSNQKAINHTISNQRLSISSVDLNEESMNMVKYQQAYNVAARIIQTFDELCDTTINGLIR